MTRVKICGITELRHARAAIDAGADFIGLVFAPSPRQVTPEKAREIATFSKKNGVPVVGVFVNMLAAEVNRTASDCGLDLIQLSGGETLEYCKQIEKPLIKAVHIQKGWQEDDLTRSLEGVERDLHTRSPIYLLDTMSKHKYGGTGYTFDWSIAENNIKRFRLMIAGGLTPENVGHLISHLNPWGVDVSSGVETNGIKDINKIKAFIAEVRRN